LKPLEIKNDNYCENYDKNFVAGAAKLHSIAIINSASKEN